MPLRILFLDVDGVMTDGSMITDGEHETKVFSVYDGLGIKLAMRAGVRVHIVTTGESAALETRAQHLGVDGLHQAIERKIDVVRSVLAEAGIDPADAAFVGDDLVDLPAMRFVGTPIAVANARQEVAAQAVYVTSAAGGSGAVREAVEWLLARDGVWDATLADYLEEIG